MIEKIVNTLNSELNGIPSNTVFPTEIENCIDKILTQYLYSCTKCKYSSRRDISFISTVGSINYNTDTEFSDIDLKATYIPTLQDLYYNTYPVISLTSELIDCEIHPLHHYKKYLLKGNINFFESLYAKHISSSLLDFNYFLSTMKTLNNGNSINIIKSTYWTAKNFEQWIKKHNWNCKKASHAIRMLYFIHDYIISGKINIIPNSDKIKVIINVKNNLITEVDFWEIYYNTVKEVDQLICKGDTFYNKNNPLSKLVLGLDKTDTTQWMETNIEIDNWIMAKIKH